MNVKTRTYHHIFVRVEYPAERGYRMELEKLPDWMFIVITETDHNKFLTVHSRIHINKEARVGPTYSLDFSDTDIIKDQSGEIFGRFIK